PFLERINYEMFDWFSRNKLILRIPIAHHCKFQRRWCIMVRLKSQNCDCTNEKHNSKKSCDKLDYRTECSEQRFCLVELITYKRLGTFFHVVLYFGVNKQIKRLVF